MSKSHYYVEVKCKVIGPKEGAITTGITYEATSKEHAINIQQGLGAFFAELNNAEKADTVE